MKIIFLDFDGVICTHDSILNAQRIIKEDKKLYDSESIVSVLVENLNKVIEQTGAVVVITSDWRYSYSVDEMAAFLKNKGFIGQVFDVIPKSKNDNRGEEIRTWINDFYCIIRGFIILDDEISDIFSVFPDNYIQTDMIKGFHEGLIQDTINKLK